MNKQEKNIVDILTFDEIEDIVDVFIKKAYRTDKTVALITNKELVEYAMDTLFTDDCVTVKRVDLELDEAEYMISVDDNGDIIVKPIEYYNDKYFEDIEFAFVDMDGCVEQATIDALLDREVPVVLFGLDDSDDECEYVFSKDVLEKFPCCVELKSKNKDEYSNTEDKDAYTIDIKCNIDTDEAEKIIAEMERRVEHMHNMFAEMDAFRRMFRW